MNHIDLFSGIGGFALAGRWTWEDQYCPLAHSEIESFPCKVYHKHFPSSLCLGDITKIDWSKYEGRCDLLTGGFPCHPHSVAGKRKASEDTRDLWGECIRALRGIRPKYALFENVPGLLTSERGRFFNRVLSDLAAAGYDAEWQTIFGYNAGIPQKRERIFIIAYKSFNRSQKIFYKNTIYATSNKKRMDDKCYRYAYFNDKNNREGSMSVLEYPSWREIPNRERSGNNDGIPNRLDRLASLGNAIVPQVAQILMQRIKFQMENSP